eukprot:jgi/Picsp_1/5654/NSC_03013-R1_lipid-binding start domain-containing protein
MATTRRRLLPGGDEASSTRSFNIYLNHKTKCMSLEERIEDWAESNTVLGGLYLGVALCVWRAVNFRVVALCAQVIKIMSDHKLVVMDLAMVVFVCSVIAVIDPKHSPHKKISSLYYRIISYLFVPRFVKSSIWTINDADVEWKTLQDGWATSSVTEASSVCGSVGSSSSSDVRSFRIPDTKLKLRHKTVHRGSKHRGTRNTFSEYDGQRRKRLSVDSVMHRSGSWSHTVRNGPNSTCVSDLSSRSGKSRSEQGSKKDVHRRTHAQWKPRMLRITSGQELDSLTAPNVATVSERLKSYSDAQHAGQTEPIPEDSTPMSPASSIDSVGSFSQSVSDYVDSWLQSLKPSRFIGGDDESVERKPQSRRCSLDAQGSHRLYTHGGVMARLNAVEALDRCALEAQVLARGYAQSTLTDADRSALNEATAINSIGLDGDCPVSIREIVTDEHLLQLGHILEERPCTDLIHQLHLPGPYADGTCLFGPDSAEVEEESEWEYVLCKERKGLKVEARRKLLRKGLYMYISRVHIDHIQPADVRPFHLDDQARSLWDQSAIAVERDLPPGVSRQSRHAESCLHRYISKFPTPLGARKYEYARRVWNRPSDGGCYAISKSCELPSPGPNKYVQVKEYISGCIIKSSENGTEILTAYFEDSQVRAGLAKMAVPKGLWPFWTKYEDSLRLFAKAKQVNHGRKSLDLADSAMDHHPNVEKSLQADDESISEYDSDDEVYSALARLKAKRSGSRKGKRKSATRWTRRVLLAGAIKILHESMSR